MPDKHCFNFQMTQSQSPYGNKKAVEMHEKVYKRINIKIYLCKN